MAERDWLRLPKSARLPFGGFNGFLPHSDDEAGDRLVNIANAMASGQPVASELALWFYQAVKAGLVPQADGEAPAAINPDRFLRALGLANTVGDDGRYSAIFKAHWVARYVELRAYQPRNAFKVLSREMAAAGVTQVPSRSTVYEWFSRSNRSQQPSRQQRTDLYR
ncbi:hypothetical protein MASR1M49_16190 [Pararhodobacter aggregans]|jgi:hypothetical protein